MSLNPRRYSVYVVRLQSAVLDKKKFREANPDYDRRKPCVYVGLTSRTPESRFAAHKRGDKSGKGYVQYFGIALMPRHYMRFNPMTYEDAARMEVELARRLRKRGYGVWQK